LTGILYLPIEEASRELTSKLLLAARAALRGVQVVLGQVWLMTANFDRMPRGTVLFKGNNLIQHRNMRQAKRSGHFVVSIEEEALGVARADQILRLYDDKVDETCDVFLAQGPFHRDVLLQKFPHIADRIDLVGNPRIDLLRPSFLKQFETDRDALRREHGKFILVNTNYSAGNSMLGDALTAYESSINTIIFRPDDPIDDKAFRDLLAWERGNIREIVRLVRWLENNGDGAKVIIRPHPSERLDIWRHAFRHCPHVRVIREGGHMPWILASAVLVHGGCTTGMEAFVADHPAIALRPNDNPWHSCFLSNLVNPTVADAATAGRSAIQLLTNPRRLEEARPVFRQVLADHISATEGNLSADLIVSAITKRLPPDSAVQGWQPLPGFLQSKPMSPIQRVKMSTTVVDVEKQMTSIATALPETEALRIREIGKSMFHIST
jgi:surface carbohydrate biosynthesis protein